MITFDLGSVRREPSRMKSQTREYEGKCTACKMVYVSEDRYTVSPVCGEPLVVAEVIVKPLGGHRGSDQGVNLPLDVGST
jgi:hypothetical protein